MWKLFKIKNEDTRTTSVASLWCFIVKSEQISQFILTVNFEQANVCRVNIEKTNTFEDKINYIMLKVVVISNLNKIY